MNASPEPTVEAFDVLSLFPLEVAEGVYMVLPLADLPPDEELYSDPPTKTLVDAVRRFGVMTPITVLSDGIGPITVADGRRRIKAARAAGRETIPAHAFPPDSYVGEVVSLLANTARSDNPLMELLNIERLLDQGATEDDVFRATGLPIGTIRRRLKLRELSEPLREALEAGEIAAGVAEQAAKLGPAIQARLEETLIEKGKLGHHDIAEARRARTEAAAAALPDGLFGPRAFKRPSWRVEAVAHLRHVASMVPGDDPEAKTFARAVKKLIETCDAALEQEEP